MIAMIKMAAFRKHVSFVCFMILCIYCILINSVSQEYSSGSLACKMHNTSEMDCSRRNLVDFPVLDKHWTTVLDLSYNQLQGIHGSPFHNLSNLSKLDLSSNMISMLNSNTFRGPSFLLKLDLSNNDLQTLSSDVFSIIPKLVYLDIRGNNVSDIPRQTLATLQFLEYLHIHYLGSKLDTALNDLHSLTRLRILDIAAKVNVTNGTFQAFAGLPINEFTYTVVSSCKACNFDKTAFDAFTSVKKLITDFRALPALGSLRSPLKTLYLASTLKQFPNALNSTTFQVLSKMNQSLTILYLYLPLRHIENGAFMWIPKLTSVVIRYSQLQTLDNQVFRGLNALQGLSLKNNQITAVPSCTLAEIDKIKSLTFLDLSSNIISAIADDAFAAVSSLTYLNIENNKMQDDYYMHIKWINVLQNLKHVILGGFGSFYSNIVVIDLPDTHLLLKKFELRNVDSVRFKTKLCSTFPNVASVIITDAEVHGFPYSLALHECSLLNELDLSGSVSNINALDPKQTNISITGLKDLTLARNELESIERLYIFAAPSLSALILSDNKIKNIDSKISHAFRFLFHLILEGNELLSLSGLEHLIFLQHLNVAKNQITEVPPFLISTTSKFVLLSLDIRENPFSCTCEIEQFRKWILSDKNTLLQPGQYNCASPERLKGISISDVQLDCRSVTAFYVGVSIPFLILFSVLIIFLFRYRWHIKYRLLLLYRNYRPFPENNEDFEMLQLQFHAYVAYNESSDEDDAWVFGELQPNMEYGPDPVKLCIKRRDFIPGHSLIKSIDENIQQSRKTILVLSPNFVQSEWCYHEMDMAKMRLLDENLDVIVLVLLKEIPNNIMTLSLCHLLCKKEYLEWPKDKPGQRLFWQRLRQELKSPVNIDRRFCM